MGWVGKSHRATTSVAYPNPLLQRGKDMKGQKNYNMIKFLKTMSIILLALTPLFMVMAYMSRGYFALGGEVVAWVIPMLFVIEMESEVA